MIINIVASVCDECENEYECKCQQMCMHVNVSKCIYTCKLCVYSYGDKYKMNVDLV